MAPTSGRGRPRWLGFQLDADGNVVWQKAYGGSGDEVGFAVQPTADGGYVLAVETNSIGIGGYAASALKLDAGGGVVWEKIYGGTGNDGAHRDSADRRRRRHRGRPNKLLWRGRRWMRPLKLNASGDILWQRTIGRDGDDQADARNRPQMGATPWLEHDLLWLRSRRLDLKLDGNGNTNGCAYVGSSNAAMASGSASTRVGAISVLTSDLRAGNRYVDCDQRYFGYPFAMPIPGCRREYPHAFAIRYYRNVSTSRAVGCGDDSARQMVTQKAPLVELTPYLAPKSP